jgi:hypothetical protein
MPGESRGLALFLWKDLRRTRVEDSPWHKSCLALLSRPDEASGPTCAMLAMELDRRVLPRYMSPKGFDD